MPWYRIDKNDPYVLSFGLYPEGKLNMFCSFLSCPKGRKAIYVVCFWLTHVGPKTMTDAMKTTIKASMTPSTTASMKAKP